MYTTNNLLYLRENFNNIYHIVRNRERDGEKYILTSARSGEPNLVIQDNDQSSTISIHSGYDPSREAQKWIAQHEDDIRKAEHLCLYGLGLGYYLEEIIKTYPDKKIFIYEPEIEIFLAYMEARDLSKILIHSNVVALGLGRDVGSYEKFIHLVLSQTYDSFSFLIAPAYQEFDKGHFETFKAIFSKRVKFYRTTMATYNRFGMEWTQNILLNFPFLVNSTSIYELQGYFENVPAIIVGSGPSLEIDIEKLHQMKEYALIIAAGSSVQALLKVGIKPHLIVSIDGGIDNFRVFENIDISGIILAAGSFINHKILERVEGPLLQIPLNIDLLSTYIFNFFDVSPKILSTTSVTGTAIQLAGLFGCSQVILMGQDLSFPKDQYYTSGVVHMDSDSLDKKVNQADLKVTNVLGGENRTSNLMLVTLRDMEQIIHYTKNQNKNIEFINASKGGAHIAGTTFIPIEKVQLKESQQITAKIDQLSKGIYPTNCNEDVQKYCRKIEHLLRELNKTKSYLLQALSDIKNLSKLLEQEKLNKVNLQIVEIESLWKKVTNTNLFKHVLQMTLKLQISIYMRYVPIIVAEKDTMKRGELIVKHLGSLVIQVLQAYEHLEQYMETALQRTRNL